MPKELGDILGCGELAFCLKAAYGLPSAPRAFFNFVKRTLSNPNGCNLTQSRQDEAVFFRVEGDEYIFVGTWVFVPGLVPWPGVLGMPDTSAAMFKHTHSTIRCIALDILSL